MIEYHRLKPAVRAAERGDRQIGVKRPGRTQVHVLGPVPCDHAVVQQQPTVLTDCGFLPESEMQRNRTGLLGTLAGLKNRLDDRFLYMPAERLVAFIAVYGRRGGRVMSVRRVNQDVTTGDVTKLFDLGCHRIKKVSAHHQHVARDHCHFVFLRPLYDDRRHP